MGKARYSRAAEADLDGIAAYTKEKWGEAQAWKYLGELESCCGLLANTPLIGRACHEIRPGLRRMEQGRHIVFYREEEGGILVLRVLHRTMLPARWSMDE